MDSTPATEDPQTHIYRRAWRTTTTLAAYIAAAIAQATTSFLPSIQVSISSEERLEEGFHTEVRPAYIA